MKVLHLTLKKKWFDMIASGEKKEEYREMKPYWATRFANMHKGAIGGDFMDTHKPNAYIFKYFDTVTAKNGYSKGAPKISWEHKGFRIGEGRPEWGAEEGKFYFILEIGELLNSDKNQEECDATELNSSNAAKDQNKLAYDIAMNYVDSGRLWFENAIKAMQEYATAVQPQNNSLAEDDKGEAVAFAEWMQRYVLYDYSKKPYKYIPRQRAGIKVYKDEIKTAEQLFELYKTSKP